MACGKLPSCTFIVVLLVCQGRAGMLVFSYEEVFWNFGGGNDDEFLRFD